MKITAKDWALYVKRLGRLSQTAAEKMKEFIQKNGTEDLMSVAEYAYALITKYGEGAATMACEMYDALAKAQHAKVPSAVPADTAPFWETKVAMKGTSDAEKPEAVNRLVKRAAADSTVKNAVRDNAQFAWVPSGDSCAFCMTLASRGWQYASKKSLKNGHAEHIHANCDCQYAIRFDKESTVQGYDPDVLKEKYYSYNGNSYDKIKAWRKELDENRRDIINFQKRDLYARNRKLHYGAQSKFETDRGIVSARRVDRYGHNNIYVDDIVDLNERQLRTIDKQISSAKEVLGIANTCDASVVVTDLGDNLASYNPKTNTLLINTSMTSEKDILKMQQGFACAEDVRSTAVHELFHWEDASEYRRTIGEILDASASSDYSQYQRNRCLDLLKKKGIYDNDLTEIARISDYAYASALDNNWEEVYTEFRTKEILS